MGGVLGMMMASDPRTRGLIDRLVINDIGPEVPQEAIDRIRKYASEAQFFLSWRRLDLFRESLCILWILIK